MPEFEITPKNIEPNLIPIGLEDVPVYASDISAGLAVDGTPAANTPATTPADPNIIPSGGGSIIKGFLKSQNYNKGTSGWAINGDGSVEFDSGYFRGDVTGASGTFSGTITATAGSIGGWSISANAIYFDGATDALSAGMAPADYPFYAGKKYADRATAPFKVEPSGKLTVTDIVATGTINAQAGYLSAGVYVDTVNGLLCESGGLNVGSAGHIRGGQTDYNTGTGFFLGYSTGYKFSIGNPAGNYLTWDGTTLKVAGFLITNISLGDASDGDVTISANTTLTRDMYYDDLTVDATKILTAAGYRIFVRGTLTNNGTIQNNGGTATTYSGAGGGASGTLRGGTTGGNGKTRNGNYDQGGGGGGGGGMVLIAANTIINNGTIRANGGNGANGARYSVGAGASPTAGTSLDCGKGGNGGAGGDSGGVGGVVTQTNQGFKNVMIGINDFDSVLSKGVGGGGGGGGGEDTGAQDDGVAGGGGGGGGGFVLIYYYTATFGTEQANKGTGGSISGGDGIDGTVLEIQI